MEGENEAGQKKNNKIIIWIVVGIAAVLLCLCIVVVAVMVISSLVVGGSSIDNMFSDIVEELEDTGSVDAPAYEPDEAVEAPDVAAEEEAEVVVEEEAVPEYSTTCDDDRLGCWEFDLGDAIALGFAGPISGDYIDFGLPVLNGAVLAINDANEEPIGDWYFELLSMDTQGEPEIGMIAAQEMISTQELVAVVGPLFSSVIEATIPMYDAAGIAMMSPASSNENLIAVGGDVFNTIMFTDVQQAMAVAEYLNSQGVDTLAVMYEDYTFTENLAMGVLDKFEALGGAVVSVLPVEFGQGNYDAEMEEIAEAGAEALYYAGWSYEGAIIANSLEEAGLNDIVFFGSDLSYGTAFIDDAGSDAEGALSVSYIPMPSDARERFDEAYEDTFGEFPGDDTPFAWHGYDSAAALIYAIRQVAFVENDTLYVPRGALIDAVRGLEDFPGITTTITCDDEGLCNVDGPPIFVVDGGEWVPAP